jgi:CHASE1-domain containing sensor protein
MKWQHQVDLLAATLNISNWQETAQDRAVWKNVTNTVEKLADPFIAWRWQDKQRRAAREAARAEAAQQGEKKGDADNPLR